MSDQDLTDEQVDRIDFVHGTIHAMLETLAGVELEHDDVFELVANIADDASDLICTELQKMTEMEFYPYVEDGLPLLPGTTAHRRVL